MLFINNLRMEMRYVDEQRRSEGNKLALGPRAIA